MNSINSEIIKYFFEFAKHFLGGFTHVWREIDPILLIVFSKRLARVSCLLDLFMLGDFSRPLKGFHKRPHVFLEVNHFCK